MNLKTKMMMVGAFATVLLSGCGGDKPKKSHDQTTTQPQYLTVSQWKACLKKQRSEKEGKGWLAYCMPATQSDCCPDTAWSQLKEDNIPACASTTGLRW